MKDIIKAVGSSSQYILPVTEWFSDLAGLVVCFSKKVRNGRNWDTVLAGHADLTGLKQPEAMEELKSILVTKDDKPTGLWISSCHLNPTIHKDVVDVNTGEKVTGRFCFTPDARVKGHMNAMRMYARVLGSWDEKHLITFMDLRQAREFLLISSKNVEVMEDKDAMHKKVSFQWQRFDSPEESSTVHGAFSD